jgi:hypothetical protein
MGNVTHNIGCPDCRDQGKGDVRLQTREEGGGGYFCPNGHKFMDMGELKDRNPKMLKFQAPLPRPMENAKDLKLTMPGDALEFLNSKFGTRLNAAATAMLTAMADPDAFIVDTMSVHRLMEHLGAKPTSGEALVGMVFSMKTDRDQFRKERDELKAGGKVSGGETSGKGLKLDFEVDQIVALSEIAKRKSLSIKEYLEQYLSVAIRDGWLT